MASQALTQRDSSSPVEMAVLDTPSEIWKVCHSLSYRALLVPTLYMSVWYPRPTLSLPYRGVVVQALDESRTSGYPLKAKIADPEGTSVRLHQDRLIAREAFELDRQGWPILNSNENLLAIGAALELSLIHI